MDHENTKPTAEFAAHEEHEQVEAACEAAEITPEEARRQHAQIEEEYEEPLW